MNDKQIRKLAIAVLLVVLALGLLSLVSTIFNMLVPLALVAVGAFAFYKIVLEGRDKPAAMQDEIAEASGLPEAADLDQADSAVSETASGDEAAAAAGQRLSAVEQARSQYFDTTSPTEEILDQIKSRRRRLQSEDET